MNSQTRDSVVSMKELQVKCTTQIVNVSEDSTEGTSGIKIMVKRKDNPLFYSMRSMFQITGKERREFQGYNGKMKTRRLYKGLLLSNLSSYEHDCLCDDVEYFVSSTDDIPRVQDKISRFCKVLVEQSLLVLQGTKDFVINLTIIK